MDETVKEGLDPVAGGLEFANSSRSSIGEIYTGESSRDRRQTRRHAEGVYCEDCGTTDVHTIGGSSESETLSTVEVLGRLENVFQGVDELLGVTLTERDCEHAVGAVKHAKQDPEWTTHSAHEPVAFGVSCAVQRPAPPSSVPRRPQRRRWHSTCHEKRQGWGGCLASDVTMVGGRASV